MITDISVQSYGVEGFKHRMYQIGNLYSMEKWGSTFQRGIFIMDRTIPPIYNNICNHSRTGIGIGDLHVDADIIYVMNGYTKHERIDRMIGSNIYGVNDFARKTKFSSNKIVTHYKINALDKEVIL